jgi:UPF0755 protein
LGLLLLSILFCAVVGYIVFWPLQSKGEIVEIKIKWGDSFHTTTDKLFYFGVIKSKPQFKLTAQLFKKTTKLKAGIFNVQQNSSNYKVLKDLIEVKQSFLVVTIPEGLPSRKIAAILQQKLEIDSLKIIALLNDSLYISQLGFETKSLEGYLYPNTYNFTYGLSEKQIVNTLFGQFKLEYSDSLAERARDINWSTSQVLTLASIIEGEAMIDSEMVYISSVYHNRLKKGMKLQADPTIQFIIPDGPRRLLNRDLEIDSPYNTYKYAGLPPGPIGNPGIKAIKAALYPAETPNLFFVADGRGGHIFTKTLNQHLRAKRKFDEIRRQVAREKRRNNK